jgi:hypothetical protein
MMVAIVFLVLLAGHLLGDWVAQTDWQATNKAHSWAALTAHVGSYHLVMGLLLLLPILRDGWPVRALLRAAGSPGFATVEWGVIAVDQALHLFILAMLALLLG